MKIKPGDIIGVYDDRFTHRIICMTQTGGWWRRYAIPAHVALVTSVYADNVFLIEADINKGVQSALLSKYQKKGTKLWIGRLKEPKHVQKGLQWAYDQIGKKYDKRQLIGIFFRSFIRLFGRKWYAKSRHIRTIFDTREKLICSEFVSIALGIIRGKPLFSKKGGKNIDLSLQTPYDIFRNPAIEWEAIT